jgi:hypothetical protein
MNRSAFPFGLLSAASSRSRLATLPGVAGVYGEISNSAASLFPSVRKCAHTSGMIGESCVKR